MEPDLPNYPYIKFETYNPMDMLVGFNRLMPEITRLIDDILHAEQPIESVRGFRAFAENLDLSKWSLIGILPDNTEGVSNLYDFAEWKRETGDPRHIGLLGQEYLLYLQSIGEVDLHAEAFNSLLIFNTFLYFINYIETLFDTIDIKRKETEILNGSFIEDWNSLEARRLNSHLWTLRSISLSIIDFLSSPETLDGGIERLICEIGSVWTDYEHGAEVPKLIWGPSRN